MVRESVKPHDIDRRLDPQHRRSTWCVWKGLDSLRRGIEEMSASRMIDFVDELGKQN